MSGYENLIQRLNYFGGNAEGRMDSDKLRSLKKALLYSYQSATCQLADGRKFRCLLNPDKLKPDYDHKIISIPYKDIELTHPIDGEKTLPGQQTIGMKCGDVFYWVATDSYWIVYLEHLEERAYFRAEIRLCEKEVKINDTTYHIYWKGPDETTIQWNQKHDTSWNDMNYGAEFYITSNAETLEYLHRFAIVEIDGNKWEVQVVNPAYGEGIIKVVLKEWFNDTIGDERAEEKSHEPVVEPLITPAIVQPYETVVFTATNMAGGGTWSANNKMVKFLSKEGNTLTAEIIRGKSGSFVLSHTVEDTTIEQDITITSLGE